MHGHLFFCHATNFLGKRAILTARRSSHLHNMARLLNQYVQIIRAPLENLTFVVMRDTVLVSPSRKDHLLCDGYLSLNGEEEDEAFRRMAPGVPWVGAK